MRITFTIPGQPVAWGRVKRGQYGQVYVPARTKKHEALVGALAKVAGLRVGIFDDGRPLWMSLIFHLSNRLAKMEDKPNPKRPDADNLCKAILDGLAPIWKDDAQVVGLHITKFYSRTPRTEITITDEEPE